jgi:hypothetical protein
LSAPAGPSPRSQDRRPSGEERGQDNSRVRPQKPSEGTVGASDGNAPSKAETDPSGRAPTPSPGEKDSDSIGSGTSTDPSHHQPASVASYTQPGGGPVNPPTKPGDGRATTRPTSATRPQDRLMSYVAPHRDRDQESTGDEPEDPTDDEEPRNLAIGNAAVERVMKYERARGWTPTKKPHNNPGYDVESRSPSGEVRYIEVKGVDDLWGKAGVPVSRTQFGFGQAQKTDFWLYVVEFARDEQLSKLYRIQNPTGKITQFRFDSGWKEVAETDIENSTGPKSGMSVLLPDGTTAKIIEVLPRGVLAELKLELRDGSIQRKIYKPKKMKLLES